jgi:hypothetical protein
MEQEKEKEFKVTDKRSAFKEETQEQEKSEVSPETSTPTEEQKQEEQEQPFDSGAAPPLPEANILTLILSLYTHVQICLGFLPDPVTQKPQKDLQQAKYNIDLLGVLKEKTKGNLTTEEEQALDSILYEIRMAYVGASK